MSLHDRLKTSNGHPGPDADGATLVAVPVLGEPAPEPVQSSDPYAELKTRVHHAVIAQLGPQLFTTRTTEDLSERVLRAVTEQVMLDGTPLTRDERRGAVGPRVPVRSGLQAVVE